MSILRDEKMALLADRLSSLTGYRTLCQGKSSAQVSRLHAKLFISNDLRWSLVKRNRFDWSDISPRNPDKLEMRKKTAPRHARFFGVKIAIISRHFRRS